MSIEILSGDAALANFKHNAFARWPSRNADDNRIEPVAKPALKAGFRVETGARVFTIGSCFARHVESVLMRRGFDLPARHILERIPEFREDQGIALNNYSVASIYNELSWALDPGNPFRPEDNFFEVYPDNYLDVHLPCPVRPTSLEVVTERRNIITEIYKQVVDCPLIIITLGLTECWYDSETKLYLNVRPNRMMFNMAAGRYELHVFDYEETIRAGSAFSDS